MFGWQAYNPVKANNTLSGYQQRNSPSFSEPTPPPYSKVTSPFGAQFLTVTNLTATYDVREVQYASSSINSLIANDTGSNTYAQLAMEFRAIDTVNLTSVWLYYTSTLAAKLNIVNSSTNSGDTTPSGRPTIATYTLPVASGGWHRMDFSNAVTLRAGSYYWVVVNATGSGGALVYWGYITDAGGAQDSKNAAAYRIVWRDETLLYPTYPYLNLMLMLDVLPVNPANAKQVRTYNSPSLLAMNETTSSTQLTGNTTSIPPATSTFVLRGNTSVTFALNWTCAFTYSQSFVVSVAYVAQNGFTQWTLNFTSGAKPNPTSYPYTWNFRAFQVYFPSTDKPQFWNGSAHPPAIWDNRSYSPAPSFSMGYGPNQFYIITQQNNLNTDPWNAAWGVSVKSTYSVSASMPSQVVAGLPFTLNVTSTPYINSYCNVSFYIGNAHPYSRINYISGTSSLITLKLNETGVHTLFLFYTWDYGDENSLFNSLTIDVLPANSNVTVTGTNTPFLGGTASLSFKFFNKTSGASPLLINPASVKINGTVTPTTFLSGVVTVTWNTAVGGWRLGVNHANVTATKGVYGNWTLVAFTITKPFCNVTVFSINSPILGNPATAQFRFRNGTNGWAAMQPATVKINGTAVSSSYDTPTGITTVSWTTTTGGWKSGSNHVNVTAASGVFSNFTVASFTVIPPNSRLALNASSYSATYADTVPIGFTFMNMTGGTPHPFPSSITLYRNGTSVTPTDLGGGMYTYILNTRYFSQAGSYHVNFTAQYGTYTATNITTVALSKILVILSIQTPQTSVAIGSSLSVSATLVYGNGTSAPDTYAIQFNFIVTYTNGSVVTISKTAAINNGVWSSSLLATSDMKSVNVNAIYAGDTITTSASDLKQNIRVVAPQGLSLMTIALIGGGGGALVVALVGIAKYRGRRKRTEVTKTKALVQTASLAQLIVVHLASGRALYSRSIGSEEGADPNLISGFLSANQSIITEVFKKQPGAGLKFADYGEYKVVSNVGNYIMATLFCTETAGEELQSVLQSFTQKFEKKYAPILQSWDGNMNAFKDADDIADEVFSMPLCSPYMLLEVPISKLSKDERAAVHSARILSGERGVFFMPRVVDFLLTKQGLKRGKAMDVIDSLTKKGVFRQLTIEQAAQVVKSTTEKSGYQAQQ